MSEAIGPRVYLVGQIMNGLLGRSDQHHEREYVLKMSIELADLALFWMQWPHHTPDKHWRCKCGFESVLLPRLACPQCGTGGPCERIGEEV